MLTGPDGQQNQVFLTPQELQQWQARQQQQQSQPGQQAPGGAPRPPQAQVQPNLAPVEGVLDTDAKGPNAFLRQIRRNLLPGPEDAEIPKNLVQKLRLRQGQYLTAMAQMRARRGRSSGWRRWMGSRWRAPRDSLTSTT
jgi:transcription termination factor Rho